MDPSEAAPSPRAPRRRLRTAAWVAALLLAGLAATLYLKHPDRRPSVLLITIDTLRADHLGCYGYGRPTSPHIDRLASEGALFERVTTSLPRTTQSIASILTGRFPKGHGARGLFSRLSQANVTLAEILKSEGYATGAFVSNLFLAPGKGFEQGFEVYGNSPRRYDGDSAPEVTAGALAWLRALPQEKPFFLWVHYLDPHWTYAPSPPFDAAFDPSFQGPFSLYQDLDAGRFTKGQVIFANPLDARQTEHVVALYDGEIAQVDAALGPLLAQVSRAEAGPTLVVLTSDHGESLGEHGYHFAHGEYLYEGTLHIPLVMSLPGTIAPGLRSSILAQNVDVAPSILALLGIRGLQAVDGRPLLVPRGGRAGDPPGWRVGPAPGRQVVFAESDFQLIHPENRRYYIPGPAGRWSSASDGRYKVIHIPRPAGALLEMYDLQEDGGERHNLEGVGVDSGIRSRLLRELARYQDYDAGTPAPGPSDLGPEERQRLKSLGYVN